MNENLIAIQKLSASIAQAFIDTLIEKSIQEFDLSNYQDERFIIKGCSEIVDPAFAMVKLTQKLQPIAKSIMYGEACSAVPLYKKAKIN